MKISKMAPRTAEPFHPGYGGILANPGTVARIWRSTGARYRRLLGGAYSEAVLLHHEVVTSGADAAHATVLAAKAAGDKGLLAESQLLAHPDLMIGKQGFLSRYGNECGNSLTDPLTHVSAYLLNRTCIAWRSNVDPLKVEESPLLEALFSASEEHIYGRGHGGAHFAHGSGAPTLIWRVGDGGAVLNSRDTVAAHSHVLASSLKG